MTQPITEQIIDRLVTLLQAITIANGYNQNVKEVKRFTAPRDVLFTSHPGILILVDRIEKEDTQDYGSQECKLYVELGAFINDTRNTAQSIAVFAADIEKKLGIDAGADGWQGAGLATDLAVTEINYDYIDPDKGGTTGIAVIDVVIDYRHQRDDPYSVN